MIVLNDLYDYGYKIYQDTDYFKFSIDSILLGEIVKLHNNDNILDMCTGNAPVPLILASKNKTIHIDAVEIQKEIANLASKSVEINNLMDTINVYNEDVLKYNNHVEYDIITANPPYFKITESSEKNINEVKRLARHEITIDLESIIKCARVHLKSNGTFYMVHRIDRFLETCKLLEENKFGIRKTVFINTKDNTPAEFFIIEASLAKKSDLKVYCVNIKDKKTYKNIFKEE